MTLHNHLPLTSTEIGSLWTQYQNDSLAFVCCHISSRISKMKISKISFKLVCVLLKTILKRLR